MILQRLEVSNFRCFRGDNVVDFAPPGERRVTVLIGENQAGKTTLIHAIRWCLYGESPGMVNPDDLLSHYAVSRAGISQELRVSVSLSFEHEDRIYKARREHTYKKLDGGNAPESQRILSLQEMERNGTRVADVPDAQTRIQELIPQSMAPFFFFEGEAAKSWATAAGGESLRRGVQDCLDVTVLESAATHLDRVYETLRKENRPLSKEAESLDEEIKELEKQRDEKRKRLKDARDELAALERRKQEAQAEMGKLAETAPLIAQLKELQQKHRDEEAQLNDADEALKRFIGKDGFLVFLTAPLAGASAMLKDAYEREQIPARIKPGFVEQLLTKESCICGANLAIGTENRKALLEWKDKFGLSDLSERLAVLEGQIKNLEARKVRAFDNKDSEFSRLRDRRAEILTALADSGGKIKDLDERVSGREFNDRVIADLQTKLNTAASEAQATAFVIGDLERELGEGQYSNLTESIAAKLADLEARYKDKQKSDERSKQLLKKMERATRIRDAALRLHSGWLAIVQEHLDDEAKRSYKSVGQLNRRVAVGKDFVLSIEREVEGRWRPDAPSESNQGVMALCFTSAFVDLAKRLSDDQDSSAPYFRGGTFPMVMDAPFSDWDAHFCKTVSAHLAATVPQLVVITKHRDWPEARTVLEKQVGRAYVINFFGQNAVGKHVEFLGGPVEYSTKDPDADPEYSQIRGVKKS